MIDREKAIEILQRLADDKREELHIWDDEGGGVCGQILEEQNAILAGIEALKERSHGEWKYNPDCVNDEMQAVFYCSICNQGAYSRHDNFCPNCGSDNKQKECGNK